MVVHENTWPWGQSLDFIADGGHGCVSVSFEKSNPGVAYISGLSVIPQYRRNGIATRLLKHCEDECKSRGIFRIDLNSVTEPFVVSFYEKHGFTKIREQDDLILMYKIIR